MLHPRSGVKRTSLILGKPMTPAPNRLSREAGSRSEAVAVADPCVHETQSSAWQGGGMAPGQPQAAEHGKVAIWLIGSGKTNGRAGLKASRRPVSILAYLYR